MGISCISREASNKSRKDCSSIALPSRIGFTNASINTSLFMTGKSLLLFYARLILSKRYKKKECKASFTLQKRETVHREASLWDDSPFTIDDLLLFSYIFWPYCPIWDQTQLFKDVASVGNGDFACGSPRYVNFPLLENCPLCA